MLQPIQFGGIYTGVGQAERLGKARIAVKSGVINRHKSDIGGACDIQLFC